MLKRTKGRLLLTLLVVTGFAGTLNDNTLTKQERKFIVSHLKDTKTDLFKTIKGLSEVQLNYKPSPDEWSVKETFYHLIFVEERFWAKLENAMEEPATPEKRSEIKLSDEDVLEIATNENIAAAESLQPRKERWKSVNEALSAFKTSRLQHLKYAKTTTADLRNHLIEFPRGQVDCYQFMIFIAGHGNRHIQQINALIANPAFPAK